MFFLDVILHETKRPTDGNVRSQNKNLIASMQFKKAKQIACTDGIKTSSFVSKSHVAFVTLSKL